MQTLPEFLEAALSGPSRADAFRERRGSAVWTSTSSTGMLDRARAIARGLGLAGVKPGDRVALIANNRVDWIAADFGTLFAGAVVVPIFATLAGDQAEFIFRDSGAVLGFVETAADASRIRRICPSAPRLIAFDGGGPDALADLEAAGAAATTALPPRADPGDLAVLIYTSGTTGNPKGVMLSHRNLVSNARAIVGTLPASIVEAGGPVLSVLPFAHIYEHTLVNAYVGARLALAVTQPDGLLADLASVRPRCVALVPRIFERVLAGIVGRAKAAGGLKGRLVPWALETGRAHAVATEGGGRVPAGLALRYAVARRLVLDKIKAALGLDRIEALVSGSAPLHRDVALTFAGFGVPVAEGYGLTETSPVVTSMPRDAIRYGTVGKPLAGVEIRIADDGEILVRGPNVMLGYYHLDERPFTEDGWFMTGDVGEIDRDGYVCITDRKKELIKTSAGKYVAPGRVEAALKRSVYVGQCFVIGEGRPFPIALVAPAWDLVRKEFGIPADVPTAAIAQRSDVRAFVQNEVIEKSADLANFESVRRIALLPRDLTIDDGELSPTLKIKRRVVEKKFDGLIAATYAQPAERIAS